MRFGRTIFAHRLAFQQTNRLLVDLYINRGITGAIGSSTTPSAAQSSQGRQSGRGRDYRILEPRVVTRNVQRQGILLRIRGRD
jgi:hypothetical protein